MLGKLVGEAVGSDDGALLGEALGEGEGASEGDLVGCPVGDSVGKAVGASDGAADGHGVGALDGAAVVGELLGGCVGDSVIPPAPAAVTTNPVPTKAWTWSLRVLVLSFVLYETSVPSPPSDALTRHTTASLTMVSRISSICVAKPVESHAAHDSHPMKA